jgi:hypothetical protein
MTGFSALASSSIGDDYAPNLSSNQSQSNIIKIVNRASMSTSTVGTGTITLGSAKIGYQSFAAAGVVDGDAVRYIIEDGINWEIGVGIYTATGAKLARTVSESSVSGAALTLSGRAVVSVCASAEDFAAGTVIVETFADLPATADPAAKYFVQSTKSLYLWTGTEFKQFYLGINESPDWTAEPDATYSFDNIGTPINITTSAVDPEGFPIAYGFSVNPADQVIAGIANNNDGTFTLTPSPNNLGSFSMRFEASDGVNVSTRNSVFTNRIVNFVDLSGGTGGGVGSFVYTAPNGTTVTSTSITYPNAVYKIGNLFNNTLTTDQSAANTYWLSNDAATGSLTFDFTSVSNVNYINHLLIRPRVREDTFSNITSVEIWNGASWVVTNGNQSLTSANTPYETEIRLDVASTTKKFRIIFSRAGLYGMSADEIKVYGAN